MPALDHPPSHQNNCAILEIEKAKFEDLKQLFVNKGVSEESNLDYKFGLQV